MTHPGRLNTAVITCPDEEAGDIPKAIVLVKDPASASDELSEKIMAFVEDNVAPHKRVRLLDFAEQITISASGKRLRLVLVEAERSRST